MTLILIHTLHCLVLVYHYLLPLSSLVVMAASSSISYQSAKFSIIHTRTVFGENIMTHSFNYLNKVMSLRLNVDYFGFAGGSRPISHDMNTPNAS
ncbi:hypothetical protein F4810DRAFT_681628 [Camillea tinctor]|nr:hypothetical protein F4810DRAFT_681628 [Camillea tinctor]